MPEGDSFSGARTATDDDNDGRIWQRLKTMFFGRDHEPTLREQLEEAIAEHEEDSDDNDQSDNDGDLTAVERTMLRNLLHFSEHRVDDVMVPRSDIVAIDESAGFADCIAAFAEHGHSRLPVYRETLDSIIGMIVGAALIELIKDGLILGFNAGDVIDLSGINANSPTGAFTLVGRGMEAGAGELAFSHLTENGHDMTVITGNTGTDAFELKVQGHHELTNDQFSL